MTKSLCTAQGKDSVEIIHIPVAQIELSEKIDTDLAAQFTLRIRTLHKTAG